MFQKLLLTGLFAAAAIFAQGGMDTGGMGGGGGRQRGGGGMDNMDMGGMPRPQRQSRTDQIADKLKLNKEQKEQMLTILSAAREKAQPITVQLFKQRAEIATAMINGAAGDDVQKLLTGYSGTAAQMIGVETEAFGKIYAMLKPNQQKNAGQAFDLIAGVFSTPARGGGQGRGRGEGR